MEVELDSRIYREGTTSKTRFINFVLNHGGIGDYICWLTAIEWCAKYFPHIRGRLFSPKFFIEIPKNIFEKYPQFEVLDKKERLTDQVIKSCPTFMPTNKATLNCTGANLVDLGFAYYANRQWAPDYHKHYCQLDTEHLPDLISERFAEFNHMSGVYRYAVLTPYYTNSNRRMSSNLFNETVRYLKSVKIVPVLLGQEAWAERCQLMDKEFDFSGCVNLLNKTSLMEAAAVLHRSEMIVGVDNGLLHLAGMLETPIVFGYTIIGPKYRQPRRVKGNIFNVVPDVKQLGCTFCLSKMRYHFGHDFNKCIYGDDMCVEALDDFRPWKKAINNIIKENYGK